MLKCTHGKSQAVRQETSQVTRLIAMKAGCLTVAHLIAPAWRTAAYSRAQAQACGGGGCG